jgi:hypothetical protein
MWAPHNSFLSRSSCTLPHSKFCLASDLFHSKIYLHHFYLVKSPSYVGNKALPSASYFGSISGTVSE